MGINKRTNDPYFNKNSLWLSEHAEMAALRRCKRTNGAVIYVARVDKYGQGKMSRPCDRCMLALKQAGIKKCVYTINSQYYF